jgi:hypothetical protein
VSNPRKRKREVEPAGQQSTAPYVGALKEVSDEFESEAGDLDFDKTPPKKVKRRSTLGRRKSAAPDPKMFPMPPSPESSPPIGKLKIFCFVLLPFPLSSSFPAKIELT